MNFLKRAITRVRQIKQAHDDAKEGRQQVGVDRYQNRYYQYYDAEGNETKRICEFAKRFQGDDELDLYWDSWLKHKQRDPPSPEVLKQFYAEEEQFREAALNYEKRDAEMMAKHRKEQEQRAKQETPKTTQTQGFGQQFEPGKWNPGSKKK